MMFLLFLVALSVVVVVLLLFLSLFSKKHRQDKVKRRKMDVESATTRLTELKQGLECADVKQDQFERYRLEMETSATEDLRDLNDDQKMKVGSYRFSAVLAVLIVPSLTMIICGSEQAMAQPELQQAKQPQSAEHEKILASVEQDILNDPNDVEGRIALGQVYAELERYADAATVYGQLNQLQPDDADILVNYAEALARSHGNRLGGKPLELLNQALAVNPNHGRGLWLAGFAEKQSDNKEQALIHWRQLLAGMEVGGEAYKRVEKLIHDVGSEQEANDTQVAGDNQGAMTSLKVTVALAEDLQKQLDPNATLFVFARAAEGPPMPLAVHRGSAKDLPLTVTLDDSMAMMPKMSLSSFPNVVVAARLSRDGEPQGQSGDFEGYSGVIAIEDSEVVNLLIDSIKP